MNIMQKSHGRDDKLHYYISIFVTLILLFTIFYLFYHVIKPFLLIIYCAIVITIIVHPFYIYLIKRLHLNKNFSAVLVIIGFLLVVIIPLSLAIIALLNEIRSAIVFSQRSIGDIDNIQISLNQLIAQYGLENQDINLDIRDYILSVLQFLSQRLGVFITKTGSLITNSIITLLVCFYLLIDKDKIMSVISSINPLKSKDFLELKNKSINTINATIKGNLAVMIIQGIVGFLGFVIFGVQSPFLLGFFYGVFALIPSIGAALIWIPVTTYILMAQGGLLAFGFLTWCFVTNFVIDQFITPRILGHGANLHPILVLFAVLGGIQAFGLIGIILGPTIITLFFVALNIYRNIAKE